MARNARPVPVVVIPRTGIGPDSVLCFAHGIAAQRTPQPQCAISTGTVIARITLREAPPKAHSRTRL